jgi:hypothetical protein
MAASPRSVAAVICASGDSEDEMKIIIETDDIRNAAKLVENVNRSHKVTYRKLDNNAGVATWCKKITVEASPEELRELAEADRVS